MTSIKLSALKSALNRTIPFASTDEARPVLMAVLIQSDEKSTRFVAADGFRMSVTTLTDVTTTTPWQYIISAKSLAAILKIKPGRGNDPDITLAYNGDTLLIDGKSYEAIDGRYPDYQVIIPKLGSEKITGILPSDFTQAAKQQAAWHKGLNDANIVQWSLTPSGHVLKSVSEQFGYTRWDMPAEVSCARPMTVGVNCNFLLKACQVSEGYPVTVRIQSTSSPMRFDFDNTTIVIMPMHFADDHEIMTPAGDMPALPEHDPKEIALNNRYYVADQDAQKARMALPKENEPVAEGPGNNFYMIENDLDTHPALGGIYTQDLIGATCGTTEVTYGKGTPYIRLEFSQPTKVVSQVIDTPDYTSAPATKSERMAALNIARAAIKKQYPDQDMQAFYLHLLYAAFGNWQRNKPSGFTMPGPVARLQEEMKVVVIARRKSHDLTPLIAPAISPTSNSQQAESVSMEISNA